MIGISGLGLISVLLMKEVPMRTDVDEQWGLEKKGAQESHSREDRSPASDV